MIGEAECSTLQPCPTPATSAAGIGAALLRPQPVDAQSPTRPVDPESLLHAPREQYRIASQLAEAFRILGLSAQNPGPANEILNRYRA